jgi:hypothetical protein
VARLGADVLLIERYNHLGGLSTGGLVIWIDRMTDRSGRYIIRGLSEEFVPKGVEHKPYAEHEVRLLLIEPRGVLNTGHEGGERTADTDVWI